MSENKDVQKRMRKLVVMEYIKPSFYLIAVVAVMISLYFMFNSLKGYNHIDIKEHQEIIYKKDSTISSLKKTEINNQQLIDSLSYVNNKKDQLILYFRENYEDWSDSTFND